MNLVIFLTLILLQCICLSKEVNMIAVAFINTLSSWLISHVLWVKSIF